VNENGDAALLPIQKRLPLSGTGQNALFWPISRVSLITRWRCMFGAAFTCLGTVRLSQNASLRGDGSRPGWVVSLRQKSLHSPLRPPLFKFVDAHPGVLLKNLRQFFSSNDPMQSDKTRDTSFYEHS
jgi:hypothetical protein